MKKLTTIFILSLFIFSAAFAQDNNTIQKKDESNSFSINFENYNKKDLEYEWKKYIKNYKAKAKKDKKNKELVAANIVIKDISSEPLIVTQLLLKMKKVLVFLFGLS